jgi:hypothetical protein
MYELLQNQLGVVTHSSYRSPTDHQSARDHNGRAVPIQR